MEIRDRARRWFNGSEEATTRAHGGRAESGGTEFAGYSSVSTGVQPPEWDVVLRDGSTIHVRPYRPDDARRVRQFLAELSPETLRLRFLGQIAVDRFEVDTLASSDPASRCTLVAETSAGVLGMATYVRTATSRPDAEAAFVLADRMIGRGLGTRLLELLVAVARGHGIESVTASVMAENQRMLEVFRESGFPLSVTRRGGEYLVMLDLHASDRVEDKSSARSREAAGASMRRLFEPSSIAVIGAGRSRGTIGSEIFHNLQTRFAGRLVPVNAAARVVQGVAAFPTIREVPGPIDLAVVAVPGPDVSAVLDDCIAKGVKGVVVISAGFGETGDGGRAVQDELVRKVRDAGIRLVGPNCLGILNTDPALRMNATFSPVYPPEGSLAMATQSGALGLAILDYARELHLGISSFASIGNKADVSSNDLIQYWASDPRTNVILLYLESFGNPRTFARLARHVGRTKPIVAIKAGRSRAGRRAAGSHTGAIASSDVLVDGLFRQAGIVRVNTLEEMFDVASLLAHQPAPAGRRLGIVTNAGGGGILAADMAESQGLTVPALGEGTRAALRGLLPAAAAVSNPVDLLASASAEHYKAAMDLVLADPAIDSVLAIFVPPIVTDPTAVAAAIALAARGAIAKPVATVFMRAAGPPPELGAIPCYRFPEVAALAIARAAAYGEWRRRPREAAGVPIPTDRARVRAIVDGKLERGGGWLDPGETEGVLDACGIPVVPAALVTTDDEARARAEALGFPVVVKAVGPELLHKTEVGGVHLDLGDGDAVFHACRDLRTRLGDKLSALLVQRMAEPGVELIVGLTEDETFGPVVVCGLGGTMVELLGPPVARLVPLSDTDIDDLLRDLPGRALLEGHRGRPPADETALAQLLKRISALAECCPEILEMDMNPVRVHAAGVSILDVRMRVGPRLAPSGWRRITYSSPRGQEVSMTIPDWCVPTP